MKYSLILATLGRKEEVRNLLNSISKQTYKNYEVIVIDQNDDNYVYKLYEYYKDKFKIKYIHTSEKGLSKARNLGLKEVEGEIVAFPDDDCEYPSYILEEIVNKLNEDNRYNIITCKSIDKEKGADSSLKWEKNSQCLSYYNINTTSISYTIFVKYLSLNHINFDELLGVGGEFGSGEESDMILNLLHKGYLGRYISELFIFHPIKNSLPDKVYSYALGAGALLNKELIIRNNKRYLLKTVLDLFLKPIIHLFIAAMTFNKGDFIMHLLIFKGKNRGFIKYKSQ